MAVFDNYAPAVLSSLQTRGVNGKCPMCEKNQWIFHQVPTAMPVYEVSGQVKYPGTSMPMAAMICQNCGMVGFFSLGALGLLGPQPQGQAQAVGTDAPPVEAPK